MLDLFCGTKSMANVFEQNGYEVFTIDFDEQHNPDLCMNILDFKTSMLPWIPDIVWASPDCTCFSLAAVGHHWNTDKTPKTDKCVNALKVLEKTVGIIIKLGCTAFLENPVCVTRKQDAIKLLESNGFTRHTVTYCKYGDLRMKPTDIWTNSKTWVPREKCVAKRKGVVNDCHHERAPRGSSTGTQGLKDAVERSRIPEALCIEIMESCDLNEYNNRRNR